MDRNQLTATVVGVALVAASVFGAVAVSQGASDIAVSDGAVSEVPEAVLVVETAAMTSDFAEYDEAEEYEDEDHDEAEEYEYEEAEEYEDEDYDEAEEYEDEEAEEYEDEDHDEYEDEDEDEYEEDEDDD